MRFASLGSGSEGNGLVVEAGKSRLLLDCGFSLRETVRRLARLGLTPDDLDAIIVTHEHADHIGGVAPLARKHQIVVYASFGTLNATPQVAQSLPRLFPYDSNEVFSIGDLQVQPYPVPHDAKQPTQHVFSDGNVKLGVLTDSGSITPLIRERLSGCESLVLECNHDREMLWNGPYPYPLKQRVGGNLGHLDNEQAADLLRSIDCARLRHIAAAHLSTTNNQPELAAGALSSALGCTAEWIAIASQQEGLDWRQL